MKIIINDTLCDLNTYINKERGNRFAGAKIKKQETEKCYWAAKQAKKEKLEFPVYIEFHWFCKNKRKDPDNICFAKKFILDGFVKAGILPDDTYKNIVSFSDIFEIDKENPRIEIHIS